MPNLLAECLKEKNINKFYSFLFVERGRNEQEKINIKYIKFIYGYFKKLAKTH